LLDYVYRATEDDYESREHICSFLWGWIDVGGLQDKTKLESATSVSNALHSEENDLHWHTFNIETFKFVVKMAAQFSGYTVDFLFLQDGFLNQSEHRMVCKLVNSTNKTSCKFDRLLDIRSNLRSAIYDVTLENMDGVATHSLSKEHKGKIFLIDRAKLRWVRTPATLEEKGLANIDYTYLEFGEAEEKFLGDDFSA